MPLRIFPFFIPVPYTCNTATYKTDRHTPTQIIAVPVEMPYHLISQNVKSEHTFTNDIVPFQRLESSEIEAVLSRPFETPQTLDEALADTNPTGIWLL